MIAECDKCKTQIETKGTKTLFLLSGGIECPKCKATITKIIATKSPTNKFLKRK